MPCKSTAEEVSFECRSHHRISSTDSKVRNTLHVSIIEGLGAYPARCCFLSGFMFFLAQICLILSYNKIIISQTVVKFALILRNWTNCTWKKQSSGLLVVVYIQSVIWTPLQQIGCENIRDCNTPEPAPTTWTKIPLFTHAWLQSAGKSGITSDQKRGSVVSCGPFPIPCHSGNARYPKCFETYYSPYFVWRTFRQKKNLNMFCD